MNKFFRIIANLINLLKNAINEIFFFKFQMIKKKQKSFKNFKKIFTIVFILKHFLFNFKILLKTDFFNFAILNIIFQLFENEK